jgi:Uma2 family endonuclease
MIQSNPFPPAAAARCLRLSGIDWKTYSRLLRIFAEQPGVRLTYDRGELEIMSPTLEHDDDGRFLGDMVYVLTDVLGLPLKRGGSVTLRRRLRRRGIEADECFWIANAPCLAGRRRLDLRVDPPPDLAIEVDVSHSSLDRLPIYAALGVPEVWRLEGDSLLFYLLGPGPAYLIGPASRWFPLVTPADLLGFLQQARQAGDQNPVLRQFRDWVRQRQAAEGQTPPST